MIKYGIRIGNVGIEFPSIQDRDKAITTFTKGSDVVISDNGVRYTEGKGNFSVYDRDTSQVMTNCHICKGIFLLDTCKMREYPFKNSWSDKYTTETGYICDACLASQEKAKQIFDAKKLVASNESE